MRETLRLREYSFGQPKEPRVVEVEYRPVPHYYDGVNVNGGAWKAYEVVVGGEVVGKIEQVTASTDRHAGRIRIPGRGRLGWGWRAADGQRNAPGLYAYTRRDAVAGVLGYSTGEKVAVAHSVC